MYYKPSSLMLLMSAVVEVIVGVPLVLLMAYVVMCMWEWFDLTAFLPVVHFRTFVGLLLVVSMFVGSKDIKAAAEMQTVMEESGSREEYVKGVLYLTFKNRITQLLLLLLAWGTAWLWAHAL